MQAQTDPAPTSGGAARVQQFVYDAAGRQVGRRTGLSTAISSAPWQCTSYDAVGRTTSHSWPAFNGAPARTANYAFKVGGNPLVSSVTDATGTVTTTVDLLGRLVSYTDANGRTTTIAFNQAGQQTATSGPQGAISNTYDPGSGNLATVSVGGSLLATTHYDTGNGRLTSVTYANGTTGTLGYDSLGLQNGLVFTNTASGTLVTGDQTVLSPAQRVTSEMVNVNGTSLTNPNPDGATAATYAYDGAGRIATAYLAGAKATYGYANNVAGDNCVSPGQGANTNRTSVAVTPTGGSTSSTSYCYNSADQLVSSKTSAGTNSQYAYDAHGNQTQDRGAALTWDATDRLASTTPSGGATTSYTYDALDRVVSHTAGGTTVRYAYAGYTDNPVATLDSSNTVLQQLVSLPGGVLATIQSGGNVWSYPDLHGNVTVTTNDTGSRVNGPVTYDPWGQPTTGSQTLNNAAGGNVLGAFGANSKLTDTASGVTVLGARAYEAAEGRFLSVDPIEGGCANNYVYVNGDPFSVNDLTGQKGCTITLSKNHGNAYWGGIGAGGAATDVTIGAYGAHKLFNNPGVKMSARYAGHTSFWATAISDMTYSYITTGKINPCTSGLYAAVVGLGTWAIGLLL
jgi:RHS repeat-associated protein